MAMQEYNLRNWKLSELLRAVDDGVLRGSLSASLEESSEWPMGEVRCAVRVYERYSVFGGNRLSLNVTFTALGDRIHVCAATSGGSRAVFMKMDTVGEETFMEKFDSLMQSLCEER